MLSSSFSQLSALWKLLHKDSSNIKTLTWEMLGIYLTLRLLWLGKKITEKGTLSIICCYRVVSTILSTMKIDQFDVKALRAFRVLRPLRLVSGVPSKTIHISQNLPTLIFPRRFTSCAQQYNNGNDPPFPHRTPSSLCDTHLCHHWSGALLWHLA